MIDVRVNPTTRALTASERRLIVRNDHKIEDIRFDVPEIFPAQSNWVLWDSGSENGALLLGVDNVLEVTRGLTSDGREFKCALRLVSADGEVWNSLVVKFKVTPALDVDDDAPPADDPTALEAALEAMAEFSADAKKSADDAEVFKEAAEAAAGSVGEDAEAAAASAEAAQLAETGAKGAEEQTKSARDVAVAAAGQAEASKIAAQQSADNALADANRAEGAKDALNAPNAEATTLAPGTPATAYWDLTGAVPVLRIGIPRGFNGTGTGDMLLSVYDTNNDGVVDRADVADALAPEARITTEQVTGLDTALAGKSETSHTHTAADVGAVPTTRTVNGKVLDADVTLGAEDVGARAADWMPTATDVGAAEASHTHSGYAPKATIATASLTVAGWTGTAAPYTQTLTIAGVPGDQAVPVHMGMAATITLAQIEAWGKAVVIGTAHAAGSVTFKALKDKPTEALPVVIEW